MKFYSKGFVQHYPVLQEIFGVFVSARNMAQLPIDLRVGAIMELDVHGVINGSPYMRCDDVRIDQITFGTNREIVAVSVTHRQVLDDEGNPLDYGYDVSEGTFDHDSCAYSVETNLDNFRGHYVSGPGFLAPEEHLVNDLTHVTWPLGADPTPPPSLPTIQQVTDLSNTHLSSTAQSQSPTPPFEMTPSPSPNVGPPTGLNNTQTKKQKKAPKEVGVGSFFGLDLKVSPSTRADIMMLDPQKWTPVFEELIANNPRNVNGTLNTKLSDRFGQVIRKMAQEGSGVNCGMAVDHCKKFSTVKESFIKPVLESTTYLYKKLASRITTIKHPGAVSDTGNQILSEDDVAMQKFYDHVDEYKTLIQSQDLDHRSTRSHDLISTETEEDRIGSSMCGNGDMPNKKSDQSRKRDTKKQKKSGLEDDDDTSSATASAWDELVCAKTDQTNMVTSNMKQNGEQQREIVRTHGEVAMAKQANEASRIAMEMRRQEAAILEAQNESKRLDRDHERETKNNSFMLSVLGILENMKK